MYIPNFYFLSLLTQPGSQNAGIQAFIPQGSRSEEPDLANLAAQENRFP